MEETRFELDGHVEDNELEEDDELEESRREPGLYILLALFIILFLTATSLFAYFQFYLGQGNWDFSFEKRTSGQSLSQTQLEETNHNLQARLDSFEIVKSQSQENFQEGSPLFSDDLRGDLYEVQIGFFRSFDFSRYDSLLVNMNVEYSNGASKLLIGRFDNFEDACAFRKDIIDMGIQGAFVVKKVDGTRVQFDEKCP